MKKSIFLPLLIAVNLSAQDFTVVGLPDTQNFIDDSAVFYSQVRWIVNNKAGSNIVFVSHYGDVTNENTDAEWLRADAAYSMFEDADIPFSVAAGNHDMTDNDYTRYNNYFGISRFEDQAYYGGHYGSDNNYNYEFFQASGMDFIILHLRYEPETDAIKWADSILVSNADKRAILTCHNLVYYDAPTDTGLFDTWGQAVYDELKDHPNLFLMLNGHYCGSANAARRSDTYNGNTMHTLFSNYQTVIPGGYMRLMQFVPGDDSIYVTTYSPFLDTSLTDSKNQFTIYYDMDEPSGSSRIVHENSDLAIAVYPNPLKNNLNLEFDKMPDSFWNIEIVDNYGRILYHGQTRSQHTTLELNYRPGIYHLLLTSESCIIKRKLIIR
ncbi:MAG: T9SS type A sorting domain-containing protein [Bacteroidales bacterium]|nr:T9SS type A sorting domain-containing protein [Bacteroidales bacterium]